MLKIDPLGKIRLNECIESPVGPVFWMCCLNFAFSCFGSPLQIIGLMQLTLQGGCECELKNFYFQNYTWNSPSIALWFACSWIMHVFFCWAKNLDVSAATAMPYGVGKVALHNFTVKQYIWSCHPLIEENSFLRLFAEKLNLHLNMFIFITRDAVILSTRVRMQWINSELEGWTKVIVADRGFEVRRNAHKQNAM